MSLLLAAMIVAAGMVSPAVRHTHEGGDDHCHQHDSYAVVSTTRCQHAGHGECAFEHSELAGCEAIFRADGAAHLHIEWLGIQVTLPDSRCPVGDDQDERAPELVLMQMIDDQSPARQSAPHPEWFSPPPVHSCVVAATVPPTPGGLAFCHAGRSLLCDTARHERSGVQLI